jgi:hypothetical protein
MYGLRKVTSGAANEVRQRAGVIGSFRGLFMVGPQCSTPKKIRRCPRVTKAGGHLMTERYTVVPAGAHYGPE